MRTVTAEVVTSTVQKVCQIGIMAIEQVHAEG